MPGLPNTNVTIRHAGHAIGMLMDGAARQIEAAFPVDAEMTPEQKAELDAALVDLFDRATQTLNDFEFPGCWLVRADGMISDMQAMLGQPDCPNAVRVLLAQYDLEP